MKLKKTCLISSQPFDNFNPQMDVVGCFLEYEGKILLAYRHPDKPLGKTWGIPSGKLEKNEDPISGLVREVYEELGILLEKATIHWVETFYIRRKDAELIYRAYRARLSFLPKITLALDEHTEYKWVKIEEGLKMKLIAGGDAVLSSYKNKVLRK